MTQKPTDHPYLQAWQLKAQQDLEQLGNRIQPELRMSAPFSTGAINAMELMQKARESTAILAETYGRLQSQLLSPLTNRIFEQLVTTGRVTLFTSDQGETSIIDDVADRCCCECGNHFDGTMEDDYCGDCWDKLNPDIDFIEDEL